MGVGGARDRLFSTLRRLRFVVSQRRREHDLAAELEFHREMKIREHEAGGLARAVAGAASWLPIRKATRIAPLIALTAHEHSS
jgi:hypothetical protein